MRLASGSGSVRAAIDSYSLSTIDRCPFFLSVSAHFQLECVQSLYVNCVVLVIVGLPDGEHAMNKPNSASESAHCGRG